MFEQRADSMLKWLFEAVLSNKEGEHAASGYLLQEEVLVRKWLPHGEDFVGPPAFQVVVPVKFCEGVLRSAHTLLGHLGVRKTLHYILCYFFWPGLKRDVAQFIETGHTSQVTGKHNERISRAPLCPIPALSQPFEHLIVDCVRPLLWSKADSTYLLTVSCQKTRYPAAYPLRAITARAAVGALLQFVSMFGIPGVMQSDQNSNFSIVCLHRW